jgi:hypothetical protein
LETKMMHWIWRLSEGSDEDNLGLACTDQGLMLGGTALIERRNGRFVRDASEIERLLSRAYSQNFFTDPIMPGLATVAAALNADDQGLARIAAVHLHLPDLPDRTARDGVAALDVLIKYGHKEVRKASPDDPEHPGWPAGTPGGRGGKFRPKDELKALITREIEDRITRLALRRLIRMGALAGLRITAELATNIIPVLDVIGDAAALAEAAKILAEYIELTAETKAAMDFVANGPHSLSELQVSADYQEFSSYGAFIKGALDTETLVKRFGRAGKGNEYHHIVTQGGANADNIPDAQLQNTDNVILLPKLLHEAVSAAYLEYDEDKKMPIYQWLQTQPYEVQRAEGLKILRRFGIIK